ncbi:hypothetical protein M992_2844 [Moellerella wisconsensis ATCC 35017]|uniref:Uncharacterized protein n=1 Tax=Moellerella wisconsensis ATCC 35017 TaxID=1354267 RepID=A0A0N0Z6K5_9GAMM|nr:hypothetical protein M992_2844 [Moellerella wisconsensis ATCC 35017]
MDDDGLNFIIACRSLSPQKSQILVQLMIANGVFDPAKQQQLLELF